MTGLGNSSTFRTISQVFNKEEAGPVLDWTSAIAAYGAFIIPKVFDLLTYIKVLSKVLSRIIFQRLRFSN